MGMTDKQFNGYIRLILAAFEEIIQEKDEEKRAAREQALVDILRTTLED